MIKLVITDIGGTLIKTDKAIIACIKKSFKQNNVSLGSKKDMLSSFGVSIYDYILSYIPKNKYSDEKKRERLANKIYNDFNKLFPKIVLKKFKVISGVIETLNEIKSKGIKIAVISCMKKKEVKEILSILKFKEFDIIYGLEDYKLKRPNPKGLNMIMKKLKVKSSEVIYVGDSVADIQMAKNAKIKSVAVKTGLQKNSFLKKENPDFLIKSFKEIKKII